MNQMGIELHNLQWPSHVTVTQITGEMQERSDVTAYWVGVGMVKLGQSTHVMNSSRF